jgi:hypothetical protein
MLTNNQPAVYILFVGMRETNRWSSFGWQPLWVGSCGSGPALFRENRNGSPFCFVVVDKLSSKVETARRLPQVKHSLARDYFYSKLDIRNYVC